jgi:hypothetical protein
MRTRPVLLESFTLAAVSIEVPATSCVSTTSFVFAVESKARRRPPKKKSWKPLVFGRIAGIVPYELSAHELATSIRSARSAAATDMRGRGSSLPAP